MGADWWERARTPGTDAWDRARTLRAFATADANAGEWARAGRTRREHSVLVRTEGNSRAAIVMGTHVLAQTGATSGAGPNRHVLQGGGRTRLPKGRTRLRGWGV
jgi:hypothetical protein